MKTRTIYDVRDALDRCEKRGCGLPRTDPIHRLLNAEGSLNGDPGVHGWMQDNRPRAIKARIEAAKRGMVAPK